MPYAKRFGKLIRYTQDSQGALGTQRFKVSSTPTREEWAEQVVRHFLNVNIHLSTLDREDEWSTEGIDYSKTWSDDGLITPWRFQGRITDLMIPEADWDSPNVNSDGYWQPDVDAGLPIHERSRLWGLNTPEMDKIYHRLMGSEKYTTYVEQYDSYDMVFGASSYVPAYWKPTDDGAGTITANVIQTKDEVRNYYWNTFGYKGGTGDNTSNWLYPLFFFRHTNNFPLVVINGTGVNISSSQYGLNKGLNLRCDIQGQVVNDGEDFESWHTPKADKIGNKEDFDVNNVYRHSYASQSHVLQKMNLLQDNSTTSVNKFDKLVLLTPNNAFARPNYRLNNEGGIGINGIGLEDWLFVKPYSYIYTRRSYSFKYPTPVFRGNFAFDFPGRTTAGFFKQQEQVPLSRATLILGTNNASSTNLSGLSSLTRDVDGVEKTGSFVNIFKVSMGFNFYGDISSLGNRGNLDLTHCPNIESIRSLKSDKLLIDNCPKLKDIRVLRRILNSAGNDFDFDVNRLNIPYITYLQLSNCNFTATQVDAILAAFKTAVVDSPNGEYRDGENNTISGVLRLDRVANRSERVDGILNAHPTTTGLADAQALANAGWDVYVMQSDDTGTQIT